MLSMTTKEWEEQKLTIALLSQIHYYRLGFPQYGGCLMAFLINRHFFVVARSLSRSLSPKA